MFLVRDAAHEDCPQRGLFPSWLNDRLAETIMANFPISTKAPIAFNIAISSLTAGSGCE